MIRMTHNDFAIPAIEGNLGNKQATYIVQEVDQLPSVYVIRITSCAAPNEGGWGKRIGWAVKVVDVVIDKQDWRRLKMKGNGDDRNEKKGIKEISRRGELLTNRRWWSRKRRWFETIKWSNIRNGQMVEHSKRSNGRPDHSLGDPLSDRKH